MTKDDKSYELIEKEYQEVLKEISGFCDLDVEEVDKIINDSIKEYYNLDDIDSIFDDKEEE
jgi:hypothetical protein